MSTRDFATGGELGSLQPFRWSAEELTLSYRTRLSAVDLALTITLRLPAAPSSDETHFDLGQQQLGSVAHGPLEPRAGTPSGNPWAGRRRCALEDGTLRLELSDVSFVNSDGALRPAEAGSIAGAWIDAP